MATMNLKNVNKVYPNGVQAVFDFNLDIKDGEFIVFVGPSGCGKSTTLRMIAGLEEISSGELMIDGQNVNETAPKDRDIAMVFQNYALYAHMTVYHNMAFSLVLRKENSDIIHERVMWAADILGLTPYLNRKPANLSGGQRQRVAVGRAMVRNPKIFLFDEPLSNLDAKLRGVMRRELKLLHQQLKTTMVYVTHDQIEALTLADRIVIMKDGYIQQVGTPVEIYSNPANKFVANFIGTPPMNMFDSKITEDGKLAFGGQIIEINSSKVLKSLESYKGKDVIIGIRPEHVLVEKTTKFSEGLPAKCTDYELLGSDSLVHFGVEGQKVIAKVKAREVISRGENISYSFNIDNVYFFDKETEARIYANK
ncbi:ABC-type transport system, ATPase component [Alteracholeplasma palmae J233]|uniref:ABC-type transport system, ATPase component n=1 Tax=Alteracholeplasma palmae (strain ATCC 49389 / J233) TaxID=1318466 RepID=U4KK82_ALTPJ|nr:sn-glycerol-3-phosphate ABC transporter ATP-binding protein UgpC [Alteracholeplasma palmae]CCV64094.1 ABC-type transport system, ATPase component [Alteracholeplasma palmae J233]